MNRIILLLGVALLLTPNLLLHAQQTDDSDIHIVQPGENLFRIALQYELSMDELAQANNITDPTRIFVGQTLNIPNIAAPTIATAPQAAPPQAEQDNAVEVIVMPNGSTAEDLPNQPGSTVQETLPSQPVISNASLETNPVYHVISRGETLRSIAQEYGTSEAELIELNNLANPNRILYGQRLLIRNEPVSVENIPAETPTTTNEDTPTDTIAESTRHIVQSGEYISAIARQYGINANVLIAANNLSDPERLLVGQELIIPGNANGQPSSTQSFSEPGAVVGEGREIVIDLSNSRIYAYDNGILMYEAVSSNGLPATPTVQGRFTVQSKVREQTMSGPGYWLPNVEWVLYFYQAYAIHGAYWHNNFGQPMSSGCVNLTNTDARWFYEFAEIGTPVTVQY